MGAPLDGANGASPTAGAPPDGGDGSIDDPDYYPPYEMPNLSAYIKKCQRLNRDIEEANVVYNATEYMRRGDDHTVEAALTLRAEVPPEEILESKEAVGVRVRVTCEVEAKLRASEQEFDIQESGWQSRSLLTSPTARWTWSVTPKQGGNHELLLEVRPVIALEDTPDNFLHPALEGSTQTYRIAADVSVSPDQWVAERLNRAASLLTSAKGMVVALTALIVAITALNLAIRRRRPKPPASRKGMPD